MKKFEQILKAGKYKSKKMVNGKWVYDYGDKEGKSKTAMGFSKKPIDKMQVKIQALEKRYKEEGGGQNLIDLNEAKRKLKDMKKKGRKK